MSKSTYDVIILGAGPAGLAASIYLGRDKLETVLLEKMAVGGQVTTTWDVENYPGFEHITGPDLVEKFEGHAKKFGAEIRQTEVSSIAPDDETGKIKVETTEGTLEARAVLVATGADWSKLGIPGEEELRGKGVSYCATCDGAFFRDKHVMVVGGGNTALDEGLFLTKFASKVTLVHRRDQLRGDKIAQERYLAHEKTHVLWSSIPEEILGGDRGVEKVRIRNKKTDETYDYEVDGVFIFIGNKPNSEFLKGTVELDKWGGVIVDRHQATSVKGVFAAGDCCADAPRQIATSTGDGVRAALAIKHYFETI